MNARLRRHRATPGLETDYEAYLDHLVDELFELASERWSWAEFATNAGVSYTTVLRLGNRDTRRPQLRTVFRLAKSLGYDLAIIRKGLAQIGKAKRVA